MAVKGLRIICKKCISGMGIKQWYSIVFQMVGNNISSFHLLNFNEYSMIGVIVTYHCQWHVAFSPSHLPKYYENLNVPAYFSNGAPSTKLSWSTFSRHPQTLYPRGQIIFSSTVCTSIQSWTRDTFVRFATTTTLHCVKVSVT